ncbi:MAG: hypothetical protein KA974_11210 [Saprospiraceae bacterium]|nr:hypothetical protein [Saprospiraceae bacterium]
MNSLITKNVYLNKAAKVKGWRVLIASHTDRRKMEADKRMMETNYPNLPIVWEQTDPYFKLKVGGCQTKLEALRLSYLLNSVFPSAIPTIDKSIKLSDFLYSL